MADAATVTRPIVPEDKGDTTTHFLSAAEIGSRDRSFLLPGLVDTSKAQASTDSKANGKNVISVGTTLENENLHLGSYANCPAAAANVCGGSDVAGDERVKGGAAVEGKKGPGAVAGGRGGGGGGGGEGGGREKAYRHGRKCRTEHYAEWEQFVGVGQKDGIEGMLAELDRRRDANEKDLRGDTERIQAEAAFEEDEAMDAGGKTDVEKQWLAQKEREKGNELFKSRDFSASVDAYTYALRLCPGYVPAIANRAAALIKLKRWEEAEKDCSEVLIFDPKHLKALMRRGLARNELDRPVEALMDIETALGLDPGNRDLQVMRSKVRKAVEKLHPTMGGEDEKKRERGKWAQQQQQQQSEGKSNGRSASRASKEASSSRDADVAAQVWEERWMGRSSKGDGSVRDGGERSRSGKSKAARNGTATAIHRPDEVKVEEVTGLVEDAEGAGSATQAKEVIGVVIEEIEDEDSVSVKKPSRRRADKQQQQQQQPPQQQQQKRRPDMVELRMPNSSSVSTTTSQGGGLNGGQSQARSPNRGGGAIPLRSPRYGSAPSENHLQQQQQTLNGGGEKNGTSPDGMGGRGAQHSHREASKWGGDGGTRGGSSGRRNGVERGFRDQGGGGSGGEDCGVKIEEIRIEEIRTDDWIGGLTSESEGEKQTAVGGAISDLDEVDIALEIAMRMADEWRQRGNKYYGEGDLKMAEVCYSESLEFISNSAPVLCNRSLCRLKLGYLTGSVKDASAALDSDPSFMKGYRHRAAALRSMGRRQEAMADYKVVLEMLPGNPEVMADMKSLQTEMEWDQDTSASVPEDDRVIITEVFDDDDERRSESGSGSEEDKRLCRRIGAAGGGRTRSAEDDDEEVNDDDDDDEDDDDEEDEHGDDDEEYQRFKAKFHHPMNKAVSYTNLSEALKSSRGNNNVNAVPKMVRSGSFNGQAELRRPVGLMRQSTFHGPESRGGGGGADSGTEDAREAEMKKIMEEKRVVEMKLSMEEKRRKVEREVREEMGALAKGGAATPVGAASVKSPGVNASAPAEENIRSPRENQNSSASSAAVAGGGIGTREKANGKDDRSATAAAGGTSSSSSSEKGKKEKKAEGGGGGGGEKDGWRRLRHALEKANEEKIRGNELYRQQRYAEAAECYTRSLIYKADSPALYGNRALCYVQLARYAEAAADSSEAIKLDPTYTKAYNRRAVAMRKMGRYDEALRDYNVVLDAVPGNKQVAADIAAIERAIADDAAAAATATSSGYSPQQSSGAGGGRAGSCDEELSSAARMTSMPNSPSAGGASSPNSTTRLKKQGKQQRSTGAAGLSASSSSSSSASADTLQGDTPSNSPRAESRGGELGGQQGGGGGGRIPPKSPSLAGAGTPAISPILGGVVVPPDSSSPSFGVIGGVPASRSPTYKRRTTVIPISLPPSAVWHHGPGTPKSGGGGGGSGALGSDSSHPPTPTGGWGGVAGVYGNSNGNGTPSSTGGRTPIEGFGTPTGPSSPISPGGRRGAGISGGSGPSISLPLAAMAAAKAVAARGIGLPGKPKTATEFERACQLLQKQPEVLADYVRAVEPDSYPTIFRDALSGSMMASIGMALEKGFLPNDPAGAGSVLLALSKVNRFKMTAMLLQPKDKKAFAAVFDHLLCAAPSAANLSADEIEALRRDYRV